MTDLRCRVDGSASVDPDGTIASLRLDLRRRRHRHRRRPPSHTYAAAGTYPVKLTVTDNEGGKRSGDQAGDRDAAERPAGRGIHQHGSGLPLDFDGLVSDSDGTISSYAWTFGDGGTGTGATASHTYAAGGTYDVKLTVTDDKGATTSVVKDVSVTGPPPPLALDHFDRAESEGWGDARFGGAWLRSGSSTNFAVQDGVGTIRMGSPGAGPKLVLPEVSSTDTDLRVRVGLDKTPTGGGAYITVRPRVLDSGDGYYVDTRFLADQTLTLTLGRTVNAADNALATIAVPGTAASEGDKLNVRVQAVGDTITVLSAKVWRAGDDEPDSWTASVADSTESLQNAGGIGLGAYLTGSATNAPVIASFDDLRADPAK